MKNNSICIKVMSKESEEPMFFKSILQCASHLKISCPTIKKKLEGINSVKKLNNYTIVECERPEEIKEEIKEEVKVPLWTCDVCHQEMRLTSKTCHLISNKHLKKISNN